jgi:hypothetical protein
MALLARIEEQSADERGSERYRLRLNSVGQADSSGSSGVTVHELSATGFLIETDAPLTLGSAIAFELPVAGIVRGEIIWASGHYFGGQFHRPLSPDAIAAALGASRVVWPNFTPSSAEDRDRALPSAPVAPAISIPERLPIAVRTLIISGVSLLLWSVIGGSAWLILR